MPPEEKEGEGGRGRVALGCHVADDDATAYVEVDAAAAGAQPISNVRYPL